MKKSLLTFIAALLLSEAPAVAAVPLSFTHHGILKEDGSPVNSSRTIKVAIVDQAGKVAGEVTKEVVVEGGLYSLTVDDIDADIVAAATELSLNVTVDGTLLSPALKISAVPYAVTSKVAQGVNTTSATGTAQYSYAKEGKALDSSEVAVEALVKCPCDKDQNANDCGDSFSSETFNEVDCYDLLGGSYYQQYVKGSIIRPVEVVAVETDKIGIGTSKPEAPLHILSEEGESDSGAAVRIIDVIPRISLENLSDQQNVMVSGQDGNLQVAGGLEANAMGEKLWAYVLDRIYPVGSIYTSTALATPEAVAQKLGGKWESYGSGRVLIGAGDKYSAGQEGGSETIAFTSTGSAQGHVLTTAEMPKHSHTATSSGTAVTQNYSGCGSQSCQNPISGVPMYTSASSNSSTFKNLTITTQVGETGSGQAHTHDLSMNQTSFEHLQPYVVVYMWRRVE